MFKRGPLIFSAAVVVLTAGFFALRLPVFIDAYDRFGWQVKCGSGFTTDLTQASNADKAKNDRGVSTDGAAPLTNYVGQCDNALMIRRAWAIPLAALGGLTLVGLAAMVLVHDRRRSEAESLPRDS